MRKEQDHHRAKPASIDKHIATTDDQIEGHIGSKPAAIDGRIDAQIAAIDEYIDAQPEEVRIILTKIREAIRTAAPGAVEKLAWGMPTFWDKGNLIHFAAFKRHIGIYPGGEAIAAFAERLAGYKTSKGGIQLPLDKPIDYALVADIARWRAAYVENKQRLVSKGW